MHYIGNIIRPPSEADSIILQVTCGCTHNKCTFCGAYKGVLFRLKDQEIIEADIAFAARYCHRQSTLFLADGDVLSLPFAKLVWMLETIRARLSWVNRIRLYGNTKSLRGKSVAELVALRALGLDRIYMGVESGSDPVLQAIRKGADSKTMEECGHKARAAGLFLSVTVLLGIGGTTASSPHAIATGELLSRMKPNQIGVLTLMLLPNTPLYDEAEAKRFILPSPAGMLTELGLMLSHIHLERTQFMTNHASNFLPLKGRLGRDKDRFLAMIEQALAGSRPLTPESRRSL